MFWERFVWWSLFLSKECHSNGCIATVDITYPAMPLYLLFNAELVNAMVRPIYKFAKMPIWKFTFAPHDAGTYPYCLGQTYGLQANSKVNSKYNSNSFQRARWNGIVVSHPMIYQYPASADIYIEENQMPIEECSNMLVIAYSTILFGGDDELTKINYTLLKQWYGHLAACGLVPKKQLCTDDFYERIDKRVDEMIKKGWVIVDDHLLSKEERNYFSFYTDNEEPKLNNGTIDKIYESWKKYAKEFFDNNDIYVSAIAIPGKALYHNDWGCPIGGERVISFNCTANPEFIKDYNKYEEGVLYITKKLKKEFQQHTITITKIPSSVFYLTDENMEEE